MKLDRFFLCLLLVFMVSCSNLSQNKEDKGLTYILDMVHNNPGEAATNTKYTNPEVLKEIGFNGMVPQWHVLSRKEVRSVGGFWNVSQK